MKTYQDEKNFVESFAKDCKQGIKENGNFEAVVNDINVIVTGMDNNNSSKVTIYTGSVNGVEFKGSITALKKKLSITYTKEYTRSAESSTKVVLKSDEELSRTADTATERIKSALNVLKQASQRYGLSMADMAKDSLRENVLAYLCNQRDKEALRRENEAKKKAEEAAKREAKKQQLLEALSAASAKGNMSEIMRLSKELKSYM